MYMYSEMPFWIFLNALMKISNQCLTAVKKTKLNVKSY